MCSWLLMMRGRREEEEEEVVVDQQWVYEVAETMGGQASGSHASEHVIRH